MGHHGAPRLPSFPYRGLFAYSLTICTFHRRAWFCDTGIVTEVLTQLLRAAERHEFAVTAYCFMRDHVHLLVTATDDDSHVSRFVHAWKQHTGFRHQRSFGVRLWQPGFYDHVLRGDEDVVAVIKYLLENPLRAGLVTDLREYPFWGSGVWTREELLDLIGGRGG